MTNKDYPNPHQTIKYPNQHTNLINAVDERIAVTNVHVQLEPDYVSRMDLRETETEESVAVSDPGFGGHQREGYRSNESASGLEIPTLA